MSDTATKKKKADVSFDGKGNTELAKPPGTAVGNPNSGPSGGFGAVPEGFDPGRDLALPRILLVHGTSEICDEQVEGGKAKAGSHVINNEMLLIDEDSSFTASVCAMDFFYEENLSQDERQDRFPERYPTAAHAIDAGHTIKWQDNNRPGVIPVLDLVIAVERTSDDDGHLPWMPCDDGKERFIARVTLKKGSYTHGGKPIWTAVQGVLRQSGYPAGRFSFSHTKYKAGDNKVSATKVVLLSERNDEAAISSIKALMGE